MKIITILFLLFCSISYGQTKNDLQKKVTKIYSSYGNSKLAATDSVLRMVKKDIWFSSLSEKDRNFRILRIKYYYSIVEHKPYQKTYLKGWVLRALN